MSARFQLSAFGDEISDDLAEQLQTLVSLNIHSLDLRGAWGVNVAMMSDAEVARVRQVCSEYGVRIACLGSPVGKSPLSGPAEPEKAKLARLMAIGKALGTRYIRVFSFYPDDISNNEHYDQFVAQAAERLAELAHMAQPAGFTLLLENEKAIVTDTPERCAAVLKLVNSHALRYAWDSANFVQVNVANPIDRGWESIKPYLAYVHIKDAMLADGKVVPAGEGDGQVRELLINLKAIGYQGMLTLEPHLKIAGHSSGFSGVEGMTLAANALRKLMTELGCLEIG